MYNCGEAAGAAGGRPETKSISRGQPQGARPCFAHRQLGDLGIVAARVIPRRSFRSSCPILRWMKLHMDNCSSEAVMSTPWYTLSSGLVRNWLQVLLFCKAAARAQSCAGSAVRTD